VKRAAIQAIEYSLPEGIETNDDLARQYPDWGFGRLEQRTGVHSRHIAAPDETALDLAHQACIRVFESGVVDGSEIDAIIFCTETPDHTIPQNSSILHGRLDLNRSAMAFDINLGCSGFTYGLEICRSLIVSGAARKILFVTGDTYSRLINPGDRATRVLFGDGAAVTLLSEAETESGIIDIALATSGKEYDRFIVPAGGARRPSSTESALAVEDRSGNIHTDDDIQMNGFAILSFFNSVIPPSVRELMERNALAVDDVDAFVFHQASAAALDSLQKALKIPDEKFVRNLAETGNLVSASIPVALKKSMEAGDINPGNLIVACGFGVGLSWGTALIRI
jgi:3-oxoacyl-[acyl-carrier-protein] synthase-3